MKAKKDRAWYLYPVGTKAHAFDGGYWIRTLNGWKWHNGDTFPSPGPDAIGNCIELLEQARRDVIDAETRHFQDLGR